MVQNIVIAAVAVVVFLVVFVIWRMGSVGRGMRQRDEKVLARLDPLGEKIASGAVVSQQEVETLAASPELRFMLFTLLRALNRPDLFPAGYSSSVAQGESALAYWLMHPNELQDAPEAIEFLETVKRTEFGPDGDFHVYRYRMPAGHWAAKGGWLLGVTGPMAESPEPYVSLPLAFSRSGDLHGQVKPADLVEWYVGMFRRKGMIG